MKKLLEDASLTTSVLLLLRENPVIASEPTDRRAHPLIEVCGRIKKNDNKYILAGITVKFRSNEKFHIIEIN